MSHFWRILLASWVLWTTPAYSAPSTIAVWPFDSQVAGQALNHEDLLLVQEVFPDLLSTELSKATDLLMVERQRLGDVLAEQKLGTSDLAEDATRLRLGRLLGVRWMVFGNHIRIGESWQIDVRIVDVETTKIVATGSESGIKDDYAIAVKSLAVQLLRTLP